MTFFKRYLEFSLTIFTINFLLIVVNLITLFISIFVLRQFICREIKRKLYTAPDCDLDKTPYLPIITLILAIFLCPEMLSTFMAAA